MVSGATVCPLKPTKFIVQIRCTQERGKEQPANSFLTQTDIKQSTFFPHAHTQYTGFFPPTAASFKYTVHIKIG